MLLSKIHHLKKILINFYKTLKRELKRAKFNIKNPIKINKPNYLKKEKKNNKNNFKKVS